MSRKTSRADGRHRVPRGERATARPGGPTRSQLLIAGVAALAIVAALVWAGSAANTPASTASFTPEPSGSRVGGQAAHSRGDASAPVTVEEWADFQCPACGQFARQTEPALFQSYVSTGKVRFVFHQLPFLGPESTWAAQASECAADEGRFWEYHDKLYNSQAGENRGAFSKENLKKFGQQLGLSSQFAQCVDSGRHNDQVQASLDAGARLGVNSTPTLFINGKKYTGAYPYEQLKAILDPLLK